MQKRLRALCLVTLLACLLAACAPIGSPTDGQPERPAEQPAETETMTTPDPAAPSLGDAWTRPTDGVVMVYVPGGTFPMGSDETDVYAQANEFPQHLVTLDGFWIDQTEVTNGRYQECVEAGACEPPLETTSDTRDSYYGDSTYDDYPVIWVSWNDAQAYCTWAGARLPTEAEWEYAARGPEGSMYPWGDGPPGETLLNYGGSVGDTAEAGSYPDGASWCGALDLAGSVWEWVADSYADYTPEAQTNPTGPEQGDFRVLRGGGFGCGQRSIRAARRHLNTPDYSLHHFGFRCAGQPEG